MTPAEQVAEMRSRGWTLRDIAGLAGCSYCAAWNAAHGKRIRPATVAAIDDAWRVYGGQHPGVWYGYLQSVPSGVQIHRAPELSAGAEIAGESSARIIAWATVAFLALVTLGYVLGAQ